MIVHDKQNILFVISTGKNVFGGWNNKNAFNKEVEDDKALIFSIRSSKDWAPAIFNIIKGQTALHQRNFHCLFGGNFCIWLGDYTEEGGGYEIRSFEKPAYDDYLLSSIWAMLK